MTENEAKQWLKHTRAYQHKCDNCEYIDIKGACNEECKDFYDMAIQALEEIQAYRAIGTVEECRNAVERMKPKKVVITRTSCQIAFGKCPSCGKEIDILKNTSYHADKDCLQKLDWSE